MCRALCHTLTLLPCFCGTSRSDFKPARRGNLAFPKAVPATLGGPIVDLQGPRVDTAVGITFVDSGHCFEADSDVLLVEVDLWTFGVHGSYEGCIGVFLARAHFDSVMISSRVQSICASDRGVARFKLSPPFRAAPGDCFGWQYTYEKITVRVPYVLGGPKTVRWQRAVLDFGAVGSFLASDQRLYSFATEICFHDKHNATAMEIDKQTLCSTSRDTANEVRTPRLEVDPLEKSSAEEAAVKLRLIDPLGNSSVKEAAVKSDPVHNDDVVPSTGAPSENASPHSFNELWSQALARFHPGNPYRIDEAARGKQRVDLLRRRGRTPYVILDEVLPDGLLQAVADENPERGGDNLGCLHDHICFSVNRYEKAKNIRPFEHLMGSVTQLLYGVLRSSVWIGFLSEIFDVGGLIADPMLRGSGVQHTLVGGYLGLHADFNWDPATSLHRRVNIFIYLNPDWKDEFGGHLEFWNRNRTRCEARILPIFGRMVAFLTSDFTYHGHPHPLTAPPGRARRSVAMYYYTAGRPADECLDLNCSNPHTTNFVDVDCAHCRGRFCAQACQTSETAHKRRPSQLLSESVTRGDK